MDCAHAAEYPGRGRDCRLRQPELHRELRLLPGASDRRQQPQADRLRVPGGPASPGGHHGPAGGGAGRQKRNPEPGGKHRHQHQQHLQRYHAGNEIRLYQHLHPAGAGRAVQIRHLRRVH